MAIPQSDGSIVLTTKVDTSGAKRGTSELRREAMKLATEYRKSGMTQSEAQKRAYRELKNTTDETKRATAAIKDYGDESKKAFNQVDDSLSTVSSAFGKTGESLSGILSALGIAGTASGVGSPVGIIALIGGAIIGVVSAFDSLIEKIKNVAQYAVSVLRELSQALIQFSKASWEIAVQAESATLRLVDIYGQAAKVVGDFIDQNARAFGMSRAAATQFSAVYGNLFSVWADFNTNAKLTNQYLQMTAVVASKTGRTVQDVQERIRSGLLGNTEAIEDLGIFVNVKTIEMTDAFQRMANGKSWEQLDAYTQQQIRTFAILEQATAKYGSEVADTASLARSRFNAAWEDFQATWGTVVNRLLVPALTYLAKILEISTRLMQIWFGVSSATIEQKDVVSDLIDEQEKLNDTIKETEKATKGAVASFDKISILSSSSALGGAEDNTIDLESAKDALEISEGVSGVVDKIEDVVNRITQMLAPLTTALSNYNTEAKKVFKEIYEETILPFYNTLKNELSVDFINLHAEGIDQFTEAIERLGDQFSMIGDSDLLVLKNGIESIDKALDLAIEKWYDLSEYLLHNFGDVLPELTFLTGIAFNAFGAIAELLIDQIYQGTLLLIDLFKHSVKMASNAFQSIANLFGALISLMEGDTNSAKKFFNQFLVNISNVFIGIFNLLITGLNGIITPLSSMLFGIINKVAEALEGMGEWLGIDASFSDKFAKKLQGLDALKIPAINYLEVPKLAQGAVLPANKPFLAMLGEQKNGTNVEAPLTTIEQAVENVLNRTGAQGMSREEHYYLDKTELMSILYKLVKGAERIEGSSLIGGYT